MRIVAPFVFASVYFPHSAHAHFWLVHLKSVIHRCVRGLLAVCPAPRARRCSIRVFYFLHPSFVLHHLLIIAFLSPSYPPHSSFSRICIFLPPFAHVDFLRFLALVLFWLLSCSLRIHISTIPLDGALVFAPHPCSGEFSVYRLIRLSCSSCNYILFFHIHLLSVEWSGALSSSSSVIPELFPLGASDRRAECSFLAVAELPNHRACQEAPSGRCSVFGVS